ncbi:MAG: UDP-N-acetylmuramate--L-alanine ligase [Pseudomonadota bacterium]|jgi:UDP-N-acetylmuramate--alanine ligase
MYNSALHFHFAGIGGSGMSGLAEILLNLGFRVSGSDQKVTATVVRLRQLGAEIFEGHAAEHLPSGASLLVYSSAIDRANPEIVEAERRGLPIVRRAEVLAELMRLKYGVGVAGSHGKTTTTSMTAAILERGGLDPTVVIGGQVKSMGSGGKLGRSDYLVAETDESDRSFLLLRPTIAVVTNIDAEHLNAYTSLAELEESFHQFVRSVPFYGLAVLCIDDPRVRDLAELYKGRKITYGVSPQAQLRAVNIEPHRDGTTFEVVRNGEPICRVHLPMLGRHIVVNSLAAIAVGLEFGIAPETIAAALGEFSGVKRRLEVLGEHGGVTVINDYGHHPTEVKATIQAVRSGWGSELRRLHVVFQPHRYTRTRDCFVTFLDAFGECDNLTITEIYAASEAPIEGITGDTLAGAITHPAARYIKDFDDVLPRLLAEVEPGDVVVCLGAGSIGGFAERFTGELAKLHER